MATLTLRTIEPKLEQLVTFVAGEGDYPLILCDKTPATDGTRIFLPRKWDKYRRQRNNELCIADSTAHEADHIVEFEDYFGDKIETIRKQKKNVVEVYLKENFSELKENPALAAWIDNIVKDRRIDEVRRENYPGSKRYFENVFVPSAKYMRPSTKEMNDLEAFREFYLQEALIGTTIDKVPRDKRQLLEEVVRITNTADHISKDKDVVTEIYNLFKENFDITQKISKQPRMPGRGDQSLGDGQPSEGYVGDGESERESDEESIFPLEGYGDPTDEREGRDHQDKKPEIFADPSEEIKVPQPIAKPEDIPSKDLHTHYRSIGGNYIGTDILEVKPNNHTQTRIDKYNNDHTGEIEHLRRIFREIKSHDKNPVRDYDGDELDYESYLQGDLESQVTGIYGDGKHFLRYKKNLPKPCWGIHADISGSTSGTIIDGIRRAFYVIGNALSFSNHNFGVYASNDYLYVLKSPHEKWNEEINHKIASLESGGGGIHLYRTSEVIKQDMLKLKGKPRCMIIISDFQVCGENDTSDYVKSLYDQNIFPFLITIGEENEHYARNLVAGIGEENYSVIPTDEMHLLPHEIFRLIKIYGVSR
jgi:hypothetical protein